jgi:excinuclease ABC subunit C
LPTLPVIAIAKREEEIYLQGQGDPVRLDRRSPALHLLQRLRDEAHRFAVSRHRARRARRTLKSALLDVPGVGPATARKLLQAFGSLEGVRQASEEAIAAVAGARVAREIARQPKGPPNGAESPGL